MIRQATPADVHAVARVHVRSWQKGYRGLMPDAFLDGLREEDRAKRYTFDVADPVTFVYEDPGIVGFATIRGAEVAAMYVDPDAWRRGIGARLLAHARGALASRGHDHPTLWLLAGNVRGQAFYESDGWRATGETRNELVWGQRVDEIRFAHG